MIVSGCYTISRKNCSTAGWWFATCGEKQGWVPSTFLVRLEAGPEPQDSLASPGTCQVSSSSPTASGYESVMIWCSVHTCGSQCVSVVCACVHVCVFMCTLHLFLSLCVLVCVCKCVHTYVCAVCVCSVYRVQACMGLYCV